MNATNFSLVVNDELIAFEKWSEETGSTDVGKYVLERDLPKEVADGLREVFELERQIHLILQTGASPDMRPDPCVASDLTGMQIRDYRLVRRLGVGGMGTVWLAEQSSPIRRKVAIKLIRHEFYSTQFIQRFESERQTLASMNHPNIAQIHEAGSTDADRPFLVMEYVPGHAITDYCTETKLSLRQRMELFLQVLDAIQHAHFKGILHRDIKPTNILVCEVDNRPIVKVIDFGLARDGSDESKPDNSIGAERSMVIGSPLWMSPEQAAAYDGLSSHNVDTRSDIFSLGVVLYQLLTNSTPIQGEMIRNSTRLQLLREIREKSPPRPSTRLAHSDLVSDWIEANTPSGVSAWKSQLRNDLDWVALKAMARDPENRYQTVAEFSQDVQSYLAGRPVVAHPPSRIYQMNKFVRLHLVSVAASFLAGMLLLLAIAISIFYKIDAEKMAARKTGREQLLTRVIDSLNPAEGSASFSQSPGDTASFIVQVIDAEDFAEEPLLEILLRNKLAKLMEGLGRLDDAINLQKKVVKISDAVTGTVSRQSVENRLYLSTLHYNNLEYPQSQQLVEDCLETVRAVFQPDDPVALAASSRMCSLWMVSEKWDDVVAECERMIPIAESLNIDPGEVLIDLKFLLGQAYFKKMFYSEAVENLTSALDLSAKSLGASHSLTFQIEYSRNFVFIADGQSELVDLDSLGNKLHEIVKKYGAGNKTTLICRNTYGNALLQMGQIEEALAIHEKNYEACLQYLDPTSSLTLSVMSNIFVAHQRLGNLDQAVAIVRRIADAHLEQSGNQSINYLEARYYLGDVLLEQKQFDSVLEICNSDLPVVESALGFENRIAIKFRDLRDRVLVELEQDE